ncbi:MAG: hypothetical protein M1820_003657 [Bogoriella megaspora]|nr:MAG: hypothetical protein M1820_003657 [Bogoriella megaspora]
MGADVGVIQNGRSLGWITLGVSLFDITNRLRHEASIFPSVHITYSPSNPIHRPIIVELPDNGVRLRFDGPDQRLRLIEILDFRKINLVYKGDQILKAGDSGALQHGKSGPLFRYVSKIFGPTPDGEYYKPAEVEDAERGLWIVSWPGIAFSFPYKHSAYKPDVSFNSLLSSTATFPAVSMAIFEAQSWTKAQESLFDAMPSLPRSLNIATKGRKRFPDEVELAKIHPGGRIELVRRYGRPVWIILNETTQQDLITDLGPPSSIYYKNDRRLSIHGHRHQRTSRRRNDLSPIRDDSTDTDDASTYTVTDDSDIEGPNGKFSNMSRFEKEVAAAECFWNYSGHGFDVFISQPRTYRDPSDQRVTKVLFHGNVPGSYNFNQYRRSRWILEEIADEEDELPLTSELQWQDLSSRLKEHFKDTYADEEEEASLQRGMVVNRGLDDSPGSSCEMLGGFEDDSDTGSVIRGRRKENEGLSHNREEEVMTDPELFGFPGLVFEVLKNGAVGCLTVF